MKMLSLFRSLTKDKPVTPTRKDYAKKFADALTRSGEHRAVRYDEGNFALVLGDEAQVELDDGYTAYCRAHPEHRDHLIEHCVATLDE